MDSQKIGREILAHAGIGIWKMELIDGCAPRMYADSGMLRLLGISEEMKPEAVYQWWYERISPDHYESVSESVSKMAQGLVAEVSYPWQHPEWGTIFIRCGGTCDENYPAGICIGGWHQDVTDLMQFEKDSLTGMYTKKYFLSRAQEILDQNPDQDYKILVSDIENFKIINEKYGAEKGNELLQYLAQRGGKIIPWGIISGRFYADKFVMLQHAIPMSRKEGLELEARILEDSPIPNIVWKHGVYYTRFDRSISVSAMVDRANLALDSIKKVYGAKCAIYDERIHKSLLVSQQIIENAEQALREEQFQVYLQPKHDLRRNMTGGAEALVRWIHPTLGFISPGDFIPMFEQNGFIRELDHYVLEHVCQVMKGWQEKQMQVVPISVNLSRRDFDYPDLVEYITETVDSYGIEHSLIHLELTETAFSDNPERISQMIKELHTRGFVIELDDFGTGYSSLITLSNLTFDVLKLDMSIIQDDKPGKEHDVLKFCTYLVKMMKLQSVAEGVETREQLERLRELECDYIQGYYFAKPMEIVKFEEYLANEK